MKDKEEQFKDVDNLIRIIKIVFVVILLFPLVLYIDSKIDFGQDEEEIIPIEETAVENGIDETSGLVIDEGYEIVRGVCGACHSLGLVTQNSATREGWKDIIVWMQETQNLSDLGENEAIILDYLEKNYAPKKQGRRAPLKDVEWYEL